MRWATRRSTAVPSRRTNSGPSQRTRKSHCTSSKRPRTGSSSPAASSSLPPHRTVTNAICRCRRPLRGAAIRNALSPFPFRPTHPGSRSWRASRCRAGSGRGAIHCRCSTSRTACCSSTGCSSGGTGSMLYDPTPMVKMLGADSGSVNFNFLGWSNLCRVEVRMRLMTAVATMVAEAIGVIDYREVAAKLGEMATYCEVWRHAMEGVEHLARPTATGKPQQNGRHERVHRTLNQETATPAAASLVAQQERFDAFRAVYNNERPHEALGQQTPALLYEPSPRPYPDRVEHPHYGEEVAVRRVRSTGQIKWAGELIFVGEALIGEPVGIRETEGGDWLVRYADVELGYIHPQRRRLSPRPLRGVSKPGDLMDIADAITTTPQAQPPQHP